MKKEKEPVRRRKKKEENVIDREIRLCIESGEVILGRNSNRKALMKGEIKGVIIASNAPKFEKDSLLHYAKLSKVPALEYEGTSKQLGTVCGKPYLVSVIGIKAEGNSKILSFLK
ncbi:MAG: 50S ribosomal protein L30e [Candidatus Anstonellales archaeon]